jgi:hypothetical protein
MNRIAVLRNIAGLVFLLAAFTVPLRANCGNVRDGVWCSNNSCAAIAYTIGSQDCGGLCQSTFGTGAFDYFYMDCYDVPGNQVCADVWCSCQCS